MNYQELIRKNLMAAIETMREACKDAERRAKTDDAEAIQGVLHALSWGMANASNTIQSAMSWLEDHNKVKIAQAKETA